MSVEDAVRVEKHSLSNYLKRIVVNSDRTLYVFVEENGKQNLITEQKNMKMDGWRDKPLHWQKLMKKV